jgi:adenine-specific DNA-methyltransferase
MAQNAADGGKRKFILVQLPEPLDPEKTEQKVAADFCKKRGKPLNIAELTKERLRRAGAKLKAEHPGKDFDTGFRVYKLATSNLRPWQPDGDDLAGSLLDAVDNVLPGRNEDDLLVELMLKTGIDLAMPSETRTIADQTVHAFGGGALMVCLGAVSDDKAEELALGIAAWQAELDPPGQTAFWFKDSGFVSAAAKANVAAILRQRIAASDIARIAAL